MLAYLFCCGRDTLTVEYKFGVLRADKTTWSAKTESSFFTFAPNHSRSTSTAFNKLELLQRCHNLLGDKVTIVCDIKVFSDQETNGTVTKVEAKKVGGLGLGNHLGRTFNDPSFSPDVTLRCGNLALPCHRLVLSMWSDVFKAMFSHQGTQESLTNEVLIEDVEPEVLQELLQCLYKGRMSREYPPALATGLLMAADKYNISELKASCEELLCGNIEISNAVSRLILGHLHSAKKLQAAATEFISNNRSQVFTMPGWENIYKYPDILETLKKL